MLRKKEYTGILEKALSKAEMTALFCDSYVPSPAVRLIRNQHQNAQKQLIFHCDSCGGEFNREYEKDVERNAEACTCPQCGYRMTFVYRGYSEAKERYCIDESYSKYQKVFSKGEQWIEPTYILLESIVYGEKRYLVARRYHFELKDGKPEKALLYRCMIVPEKAEDDYALLYENTDGEIKVSRSERPDDWFLKSDYWKPDVGKHIVLESAEPFIREEDTVSETIRTWCKKLQSSITYYSPAAITIRTLMSDYPGNEVPKDGDDRINVFEDHGDYVLFRTFYNNPDHCGVIFETRRWTYSLKTGMNQLLVYDDGKWNLEDVGAYRAFSDSDLFAMKEEARKSFLGRTGLYEYLLDGWGNIYRSTHGVSYLSNLAAYPIIETLAKIGLRHLVDSVIDGQIRIRASEKTIWAKLGLSKANFEMAKREEFTEKSFIKLIQINPYDEKVDMDAFCKWNDRYSKMSFEDMRTVFQYLPITLKDMVDYIESVYFDQGCPCDEAIKQWKDYLRNFQALYGRDPKTRDEKYPDSLKKAHDVTAMQNNFRAVMGSYVEENLSAVYEKWKHLEFEDGRYCIILPKESREIAVEGIQQHHCVSGYISSVINGECLILFLRKKDEADRSFFTLEYDLEGNLQQIKGHHNRLIHDLTNVGQQKDIIDFLRKWGKKNRINVEADGVEVAA